MYKWVCLAWVFSVYAGSKGAVDKLTAKLAILQVNEGNDRKIKGRNEDYGQNSGSIWRYECL